MRRVRRASARGGVNYDLGMSYPTAGVVPGAAEFIRRARGEVTGLAATAAPEGPGPLAEIGAELARVRAARGLSLADVGRELLLSSRQVRALEQVEPAAFHGAAFQDAALRKYAKYCGLDLNRFPLVPMPRMSVAPAPPADREPNPVCESARWPKAITAALAAASGAALISIVVGAIAWWPAGPPPAVPAPNMVVGALDTPTVPTAAVSAPLVNESSRAAAPASSQRYGAIQAVQATWMFLHLSDGSSIERTIGPGETLALDARPDYLVLGRPDVILTIGGRQVDTAPFIDRGQVRMTPRDFLAAEQGAPP